MTTVADLAAWMEEFAPRRLAESWDNVGLLWGDPASAVERVLTCLTVTAEVADEAIAEGAGAIVSHHPILFKAVQSVRADDRAHGFLWRLARAGVAVLSPHTAFDNTAGGINDLLSEAVGLADVRPLRPAPGSATGAAPAAAKVVVFVPPADRDPVLAAAFAAGAGTIGNYDECSFTTAGRGTFLGNEGANPTVGQVGRRETVREWKVEVVCPTARLGAVLESIRAAHSYEEPAIDVFPMLDPPDDPSPSVGVGRIGRLAAPEPLGAFAARVARRLESPGTQFAGDPSRPVETVAIACGAGDDFLRDAARAGADALLTGEARFHRALEAEALGLGLVVAGHHATERIGVVALADRIAAAFPGLAARPSRREHDPLRPA